MNEANEQFPDALKKIIDSYGKELLGDSQKLNALLMDIAPRCSKERKLICQVIDCGVGRELLKAAGKTEEIQRQYLTKCMRQLKNDTWIAENGISYALNVIAAAVGMTISGNKEKSRTEENAKIEAEKAAEESRRIEEEYNRANEKRKLKEEKHLQEQRLKDKSKRRIGGLKCRSELERRSELKRIDGLKREGRLKHRGKSNRKDNN